MAQITAALTEALTFDDVLLKPGLSDVLPSEVDIRSRITRAIPLNVPIIASAMDAVVSPATAGLLRSLGSLAFINLEGLWFRYDDPRPCFAAIVAAPDDRVQQLFAELYAQPLDASLIARRAAEMRAAGAPVVLTVNSTGGSLADLRPS